MTGVNMDLGGRGGLKSTSQSQSKALYRNCGLQLPEPDFLATPDLVPVAGEKKVAMDAAIPDDAAAEAPVLTRAAVLLNLAPSSQLSATDWLDKSDVSTSSNTVAHGEGVGISIWRG